MDEWMSRWRKNNLTRWIDIADRNLFCLPYGVNSIAAEKAPDTYKIKIHGKDKLSFPESNAV